MLAGWLPRGIIDNEPLKDTIRRTVPSGWADHPNLWIVACDYANGHRVPFGRADAPEADLADAVAASCSIPGFYRPVRIAGKRLRGRRVWSTSNLDVLRNERARPRHLPQPDLVAAPAARLEPGGARRRARAPPESGRRLGWEATPPARARHEGRDHPADLRRPRGDGAEPDVNEQPQPGDRDRDPHRGRAAAGPRDARAAERTCPPATRTALAVPAGPPSTWPQDLLPGGVDRPPVTAARARRARRGVAPCACG